MLILSALVGYLIIYTIPRYRFPIEPFFILLAAVTVDGLVARLSAWRRGHLPTAERFPAVA
jgi:hypothetical protein